MMEDHKYFPKHKKVNIYLANLYSHGDSVLFDELICIGNQVYIKRLRDYDPVKGSFNTFIKAPIQKKMLEYLKEHKQAVPDNLTDYYEKYNNLTPDKHFFLTDFMKKISTEAKEVMVLIFNSPIEFLEFVEEGSMRSLNRTGIKKFLIKHKRWSDWKVKKVFKEIEQRLSE